jgi:hypothetical protein
VKVPKLEKVAPMRMRCSHDLYNVLVEKFTKLGWKTIRLRCDLPTAFYVEGYANRSTTHEAYRELDLAKERVGLEVHFGKPLLDVCSTCAKMTIFRNLGHIDCGIEIVPVKAFADEMSTGVSYFEQFVWDLESRGVADIDVPVLILGIDA